MLYVSLCVVYENVMYVLHGVCEHVMLCVCVMYESMLCVVLCVYYNMWVNIYMLFVSM